MEPRADDLEIPYFLRRDPPSPEERDRLIARCLDRLATPRMPISAPSESHKWGLPRNIEPAGLAILAAQEAATRRGKKQVDEYDDFR